MDGMDKIYRKILKEIDNQKLKTKDLAREVGCSQRYIQYILKGDKKIGLIKLTTMDKLLKTLGLTLTIGKEKENGTNQNQ